MDFMPQPIVADLSLGLPDDGGKMRCAVRRVIPSIFGEHEIGDGIGQQGAGNARNHPAEHKRPGMRARP